MKFNSTTVIPCEENTSTSKYKRSQPKLPEWQAKWYEKLAVFFLGALPAVWQRNISRWYAQIFTTRFSKYFIAPFCWFHFSDPNYLKQFKPPNGKEDYECFQDFFTRVFKEQPLPKHVLSDAEGGKTMWTSEGNLCHAGYVKDIPQSNVKGQIKSVSEIFGLEQGTIPQDYFFSNIFLHNKNYHRIHAPVGGTITRIQHIPGDLVVLRPWIYSYNPSTPAFRNERINIDILDENGKTWYLSIIGGPAVGAIHLAKAVQKNKSIKVLQELAVFHLGSTCCMAAPKPMRNHKEGDWIEIGDCY